MVQLVAHAGRPLAAHCLVDSKTAEDLAALVFCRACQALARVAWSPPYALVRVGKIALFWLLFER